MSDKLPAIDDTLKWLLSLVSNNPWRDIYLRMDDFSEISLLENVGWIKLVDVRVVDGLGPKIENTYRFTRSGMRAAVSRGIIPEVAMRTQDLNATYDHAHD